MSESFQFQLKKTNGGARLGEVSMPRGTIRTPAFMPVGTVGTVKAMYLDQVRDSGADIILGNTYHLMLRPGAERVARLGGLHELIRWQHPILTDSGGFQVMSLSGLRKLDEKGVTFKSHVDGSLHHMSPERSIEIQGLLGSDIQMQLDECVALPSTPKEIERAMEMSLRWADRCKVAFGDQPGKAMFGIVQGGDIPDLRVRSAQALSGLDLKGYAVGGLAVGDGISRVLFAYFENPGIDSGDRVFFFLFNLRHPSPLLSGGRDYELWGFSHRFHFNVWNGFFGVVPEDQSL